MKFDRTRLIFGLYLLVLIVLFELVMGHLHLPAWPAFMAMIFFFVENMDVKKASHILVGAVFGIGCILLARPIIGALAPLLGLEGARLAYIVILVYAIVAFGEMLPAIFNNYAFMYLTVTGLAVQLPDPNPFLWMGIAAIGIGRFMMMQAAAKQPSASPS
jgi:hypothetical protein